MRFAMSLGITVGMLAGCESNNVGEQADPEAMPTAGIYTSFDSKGGGQVLGDRFVRAPGEGLAQAAPGRSCWDGSRGLGLGSFLMCPPRPSTVVVTNDSDGQIVVSSANVGPVDDGEDDSIVPIAGGDDGGDNPEDPEVAGDFVAKYDRIEEVYGTRDWQSLPDEEQAAVRDFFSENGGESDWSGFDSATN